MSQDDIDKILKFEIDFTNNNNNNQDNNEEDTSISIQKWSEL